MKTKLTKVEIEFVRSAIAAYAADYIASPVRYVAIDKIEDGADGYDHKVFCEIGFADGERQEIAGVNRNSMGVFEVPLD